MRRDQLSQVFAALRISFQSTRLHEAWLCVSVSVTFGIKLGFNPHACMRRDRVIFPLDRTVTADVSIHTPAWGVTTAVNDLKYNRFVSIHTPAWGVTKKCSGTFATRSGFNPHACMRRDLFKKVYEVQFLMFQSTRLHEAWLSLRGKPIARFGVSIHTPAWGVTWSTVPLPPSVTFQSTRLHEAWLSFRLVHFPFSQVSIHTPAWGVTLANELLGRSGSVSIHTPAWGVTEEP